MKSLFPERPLITTDHCFDGAGRSFAGGTELEHMADAVEPDNPGGNAGAWPTIPSRFRACELALPAPWEARFGPLRRGAVDRLVVVGQIGQSIDGRIATVTGHSKYINGPAGLAHLHRLRALVDAVLIGIGTAVADDPLLTVRRCAGPSPERRRSDLIVDAATCTPSSANSPCSTLTPAADRGAQEQDPA